MKPKARRVRPRCQMTSAFMRAIVTGFLLSGLLACSSPTPTPEPEPTVLVSTDTPPPEPPTGAPTEPPPTPSPPASPTASVSPPTPALVACPAAGSPTLARPDNAADYPAAIQQYLSAGGSAAALGDTLAEWKALPDATTAQVAAADLTGDGNPEVVVALKDPSDLLVFGCQGGAYVPSYSLQQSVERWEVGWVVNLQQVDDMNTDGRPEIAFTLSTCGAHTCYKTLEILGWDGMAFASLMGGSLDMPYPDYVVTPGRIEAQSGPIGSVGAEPQRGYSEVWEWDGSVFTVTQQIWEPPIYRYHALLDGDRALMAGDYTVATTTYERVISDDALQEWGAVSGIIDPAEERTQLTAFARWRLVLVYLLTGETENAQSAYDQLQADYPPGTTGHDVSAMAGTFWMAYLIEDSVAAGCTEVVTAAMSKTAVQDFFNWNYGYANPYWEPLNLCPFVD